MTLPTDPYEQEVVIRNVLVPRARVHFCAFQLHPHLLEADWIGLTITAAAREAQVGLWKPGTKIAADHMSRCTDIAIRVFVHMRELSEPRWAWTVPIGRGLSKWYRCAMDTQHRVARAEGSLRDHALSYAIDLVYESSGLPRDPQQYLRVVGQVASKLELTEDDSCSHELQVGLLRMYGNLTGCGANATFVDDQHRITLGYTQARDKLFSAFEVARRPSTKPAELQVLEAEGKSWDPEDEAVQDAVEAAHAVEATRRFSDWVNAQVPRVRAGSVAADVLSYVVPFVMGDVTPTEIARATNRDGGAVHRELRKHARAMQRDLAAQAF